jgi:valyl-tRNA synthetase
MFFHGMLRDLEGRKFSKSLGNGIEPTYLIEKWGVDATRMALYTYSIPGRDGRVSRQILDERGKNFRNFGTKLRNIARFILDLTPDNTSEVNSGRQQENTSEVNSTSDKWIIDELDPTSLKLRGTSKTDSWIISELDKTIKKVTTHLEKIELHLAVDEIYSFVWHEFADKYIEKSKSRRDEAQPTLEKVLKQVLILLHPFMPFVTEEIYQKFGDKKKSIMMEEWPTVPK